MVLLGFLTVACRGDLSATAPCPARGLSTGGRPFWWGGDWSWIGLGVTRVVAVSRTHVTSLTSGPYAYRHG
jgi:hypothetical protein